MVKLRGKEAYPIYFGAKPEILRLAAELRNNMTPAEKVLWEIRFKNEEVINNTDNVIRQIEQALDNP